MDYSVDIFQADRRKSFIRQGFLFCVVTSLSRPQLKRRFVYCLHCSKLRSVAWFYRHKEAVNISPSDEEIQLYESRMFHFQQDIATELELISSSGKLFVERPEEPTSSLATTRDHSTTFNISCQSHDHCPSQFEVLQNEFEDEVETEDDHEDISIQIERTVDSISDCFLN